MKKFMVFNIMMLISLNFIIAQEYCVDKGSTMVSGSISFTSQGGDLFEDSDGKSASIIMLAPLVNYFVVHNFAIGAAILYTGQSQGDFKYHSLGIGPNLSYYFGSPSSTAFPYLGAGIRYYTIGNDDNSAGGTDIALGGGVLVMAKDHFGLVFEVGYHIMNLKDKDSDESASGNIFSIGIGIAGLLY